MEKIFNFIGGEFRPSTSGQWLDNVNPATGKVYSLIADSDASDVTAAIVAAKNAFPAWSKTSADKRAGILRRLADLIGENLEKLALAESIDNGKPLSLSRSLDIPRAQTNFQFFADTLTELHGHSFHTGTSAINYTSYKPLGVVVTISPWNLPLYLLTWKLAPALAAGNTVVAKPSEVTPMTAFLLCKLALEAGLPPGVLNMVHGLGPKVGPTMTSHPDVKAVSFTGSTATGRQIALSAAPTFKKVSLEMGGKNANIIFADCDFEKALATTVRSTFLNQGQICLCGSRIFIEKSIYEKFKNALVEKALALRQGDPLDATTEQGAIVSEVQLKKVLSYIELAKQEGGKILCGGERASVTGENAGGYFIKPTLIENLPHTSRVNQEEIFGPVATLIPFSSEEEVVDMANSTNYGLSASVWTSNLQRAHRVSQNIEAGVVWINTWMMRDLRTPFGGVKESGVGREGGVESLQFFSEIKNVCLDLQPLGAQP
jgi:aminomuconate-semialdehyde/2-hydroxymuconate-6-semialdehyde dehydrogenase